MLHGSLGDAVEFSLSYVADTKKIRSSTKCGRIRKPFNHTIKNRTCLIIGNIYNYFEVVFNFDPVIVNVLLYYW